MHLNLTTELAQFLNFTSKVATAIRMYSAYNQGDSERQQHAPLDVMLLSDSLHNLDMLASAIQGGHAPQIVSACDALVSMYTGYLGEATFERNRRVALPEGIAIFSAIREKVLQTAEGEANGPRPSLAITTFGRHADNLELAPVWQQTMAGAGWVFLDGSTHGDARGPLEELVKRMGHASKLRIVDVAHNADTLSINVLSGSPKDVATQLASVLPTAEESHGADYVEAAHHAIPVLVEAMRAAGVGVTLGALANCLQSPESLLELFARVPRGTEARSHLQHLLSIYKIGPDASSNDPTKLRAALGRMAGRLGFLSRGSYGNAFASDAPEICMSDVLARHELIYVKLGDDSAAPMARRLIAATLKTAVEASAPQEAVQPAAPFALFEWTPATE